MNPEVVCVGLATADTIVSVPGWPTPDSLSVADELVRGGGGPAATAAVTLARLGHRAAIVAAVGTDESGPRVRGGLEAEGVDVTYLVTLDGPTPESVVLIDRSADTRTLLHRPGVALERLRGVVADAGSEARWIHADHVGAALLTGIDPPRRSIDEGYPVEGLALAGVGLYAPSAPALERRFPGRPPAAAMRAALDAGAVRVVVTRGAEGALAADATGAWRVPAMTVEVVSTVGAGDVFHGALLASLLDGLPLNDATRRASVAASLSCRALDGRGAIPTRTELDRAVAIAPSLEPVELDDTA